MLRWWVYITMPNQGLSLYNNVFKGDREESLDIKGLPEVREEASGPMDLEPNILQLWRKGFFSYLYNTRRFTVEDKLLWVKLFLNVDVYSVIWFWELLTPRKLEEQRRYSRRCWTLRSWSGCVKSGTVSSRGRVMSGSLVSKKGSGSKWELLWEYLQSLSVW